MTPFRRFLRLRYIDRRLLVKCAVLLAAIRLGLWLLPFKVLRQLLGKLASSVDGRQTGEPFVSRVAWAMSALGRNLPRVENCLTQALATQLILARNGHAATLRIGVARDES